VRGSRLYCATFALLALACGTPGRGCPSAALWTVVRVREPRPSDVPFEDATRYLWPSDDANNVPGPDSLVAHVRSDAAHRTYLELEDRRSGQAVRLDDGGSLPRWSPNGKYVSSVVWKSPRQPHELTVIDVATRRIVVDPDVQASGTEVKWSPDSRTLAAAGVIYGEPRGILYTVSIPEGRVRVIDSLAVLSDYEFSWSPDGRWISFSRPTELDPVSEEPIAADLWIADAATGETWPVLKTPEWVESNPLWITNRAIQVDRARRDGNETGVRQRVVVEFRCGKSRASP
jgi:WD40-like Beta Propeller Repeat